MKGGARAEGSNEGDLHRVLSRCEVTSPKICEDALALRLEFRRGRSFIGGTGGRASSRCAQPSQRWDGMDSVASLAVVYRFCIGSIRTIRPIDVIN